jgi:polysaccharide pyruvyl transferase WcaK-like protein
MKIGIMTYWGQENYGQNLQLYAMSKWLTGMGHDAFLIRYLQLLPCFDNIHQISMRKFMKLILPGIAIPIWRFLRQMAYRKQILTILFGENKKQKIHVLYPKTVVTSNAMDVMGFINKNIKCSTEYYGTWAELAANPPQADVYLAGSDQVWNFWEHPFAIVQNDWLPAFFLDFGGNKTKRISYAASFGDFALTKQFSKAIAPLLKKFDYVSVREQSGIAKCMMCGKENAEWVPDPTLLISPEQYRELYDASCKKPDGKYIFIYALHHLNVLDAIEDYASSKGLEVVIVSPEYARIGNRKITFATIPQWIYLIENAEYVITDSFHGTIFSMLFGKNFANIAHPGYASDPRFASLYELFAIKTRTIKVDDFSVLDIIPNYDLIKNRLLQIREKYNRQWFEEVMCKKNEKSTPANQ